MWFWYGSYLYVGVALLFAACAARWGMRGALVCFAALVLMGVVELRNYGDTCVFPYSSSRSVPCASPGRDNRAAEAAGDGLQVE